MGPIVDHGQWEPLGRIRAHETSGDLVPSRVLWHLTVDRAIFILYPDEESLERTQQGDGQPNHDGRPDEDMDPDRRALRKIEPNGTHGSDRADDKNDEDGRTVGGVMMGEVEIANIAAIRHFQKSTKKPAPPTSGAAAGHGF